MNEENVTHTDEYQAATKKDILLLAHVWTPRALCVMKYAREIQIPYDHSYMWNLKTKQKSNSLSSSLWWVKKILSAIIVIIMAAIVTVLTI